RSLGRCDPARTGSVLVCYVRHALRVLLYPIDSSIGDCRRLFKHVTTPRWVFLNSDKQQRVRHLSPNCQGSERTGLMAKRKAARRGKPAKAAKKRSAARGSAKRPTKKRPAKRQASAKKRAPAKKASKKAPSKSSASGLVPGKVPRLDRARRTLDDRDTHDTPPSSLDMERRGSAARTGRAEAAENIREHHGMDDVTGGDPDV